MFDCGLFSCGVIFIHFSPHKRKSVVVMKISPGTVAAIAASLMAQGENLGENSEIFSPHWAGARNNRIKQFVRLAAEIAHETEILHDFLKGEPHA